MTDRDFRAYLLGQMPPDEAARLEEELLQDQETFDAARGAEDDLFDEYARGALDAESRQQFLTKFGGQPERIAFAEALARRTSRSATIVPFRSPRRGYWVPLTAAATLLIGIVGWRLAQPDATPRAPQPATPAPVRAEVRPAPAPLPFALLTLSTSRAASNETVIDVPNAATAFELRVRLDPADTFEAYVMELRSSADAIVWKSADLTATVAGDRLVAGQVPADVLAAGSYELSVRGRRGANVEDLGFMTLKVTRTP